MFLIESVVYIIICLYFWLIKGPWQVLQLPNSFLSVAGIVFLFFMPESPRFLISKKRFEEARTVFKWIGGHNGLDKQTIDERLDDIIFEGESRVMTNGNAGFDKILLRVSNQAGQVNVEGETPVPEGGTVARMQSGRLVFESTPSNGRLDSVPGGGNGTAGHSSSDVGVS